MSIKQKYFGTTSDGREVSLITITNRLGHSVSIMDYGATLQSIIISDKNNNPTDCILGYATLGEYENHFDFLGSTVGRVCGRIAGAEFCLNGQKYELAKNDGNNNLHGGPHGFERSVFNVMIADEQTVVLSYNSPDMESGFPGNLAVKALFSFDDNDNLTIEYQATSDQDTIVSMTNHAYFNLSGEGNGLIENHMLKINSSHFLENQADNLPTGRILAVEGTPFDFQKEKAIAQDIDADDVLLHMAGGYDHNFCIDGQNFRDACTFYSPITQIQLDIATDLPGIQVYTGNFLSKACGKSGHPYSKRSGIALETQRYPDAVHHEQFPSVVLRANDLYHTKTIYHFSIRS